MILLSSEQKYRRAIIRCDIGYVGPMDKNNAFLLLFIYLFFG